MKIPNALTAKVGRLALKGGKHSPTLMFAGGVVGMVGTVVLASRATLKLEEVLDEAEKTATGINELQHADYSETDRKKDKALHMTKTVIVITKLYAPAFGLGIVSVGLLTGSHVVLTKRNVALTAAYATIEKGFNEYRDRVREEFGEETDQRMQTGSVEVHETVAGKDGKTKVVTKKVQDPNGISIYARFFDESCADWQRQPEYNLTFLKCKQTYLNDMLLARGHVFLNEVYDELGIPRSKAGAVVGWVLNKKDGTGDNFIDFGLFDQDNERARAFINGQEPSIRLDFNVDGVIYDKI